MFDFSKAFDTIDHSILLETLYNLGFSQTTIQWFHHYLLFRQQAVVDENGNPTEFITTCSGVPQGSVLGPILFLIYMNSILNEINYCHYELFVDDLQIYIQCKASSYNSAIINMQNDVNSVVDWTTRNHLKLNPNKIKAINFGTAYQLNNLNILYGTDIPSVTVSNVIIPYSTSVLNLGVILTPTLNWSMHIMKLSKNVHYTLHRLRLKSRLLSYSLRTLLVSSLIVPFFDYCCLVYDALDVTLMDKVERIFNLAIRFIFGVGRYERVSITSLRNELNWLTANSRRKYYKLVLVHSLISTGRPSYLSSQLKPPDEMIRRSQRNLPDTTLSDFLPLTFALPTTYRTEFYKSSFIITAINEWNNLPFTLKKYDCLDTFKIHIMKYLLHLQKTPDLQ